ncbi:DUF547 domain-containing protein [Muricauda sp. MAR_2010_75]|uniref:DUF547 domain-containing protein n=1 Tax=Allomuricauda sp. MAR_2010_75 TaxID=1250232 RepID=UPI00055C91AF|nr:DUF547 domain-containing protein [Muricauda sp. MAR_2010_75]
MKTRNFLIICALTMVFSYGFGQGTSIFFERADSFFGQYVKDGKVDYRQIHANPEKLNSLLELAKNVTVAKTNPKTYQAFWINAYNLCVIKGVMDSYPIDSPLDVPGFFDTKTYFIGNAARTLNEIENNLLRANFPNEPRFHFALVCAGLGCPPIIDKAYLPQTLERQLQKQTELSLNNPHFVRIDGKQVGLSQIFEWYAGDFTKDGKSFIDFVNMYRTKKLDPALEVVFYPYDWSLNKME